MVVPFLVSIFASVVRADFFTCSLNKSKKSQKSGGVSRRFFIFAKNLCDMKKYILIAMLLIGAALAVSCNKEETVTDPLDGTIWTRTSHRALTNQDVIYYLEFNAGTVRRWNTENDLSGSGKYEVEGSNVTFTDFVVPTILGGSISDTYTSATFNSTSMTVVYYDKYDSYSATYIKK